MNISLVLHVHNITVRVCDELSARGLHVLSDEIREVDVVA